MKPKNSKQKQPSLAVANMPFTPMTNRAGREKETPYQPLKIDDLRTPISNKSRSSEHSRFKDSPQSYDFDDDEQLYSDTNGFTILKNLLTNALQIVEKLECESKNKNKKYKDAQVQTENFEDEKENCYETTEISIINNSSDSNMSTDNSSIKDKKDKYKYNIENSPLSYESYLYSNTKSSKNSESSEKALENKMHDLSILLQKLENQLDEMNQTDYD